MIQIIWNKNGKNIRKPKDPDNGYTAYVKRQPIIHSSNRSGP